MPGHTKKEKAKKAAFSEVAANPPAIIAKTRAKKGAKAARKQAIAIALSKARRKQGSSHLSDSPFRGS